MTAEKLLEEVERLTKRLDRERRARQEAENLAEKGTRQLYERQRELELLQIMTDAANGAVSVHEALQVTLNEICSYTGWPLGHVYFVGEDSETLIPGKIWHFDQPQKFESFRRVTEATPLRRGEGLPGSVLEKASPVWIADVSKMANFPRSQQSLDIGVVAAFAFPVMVGPTVAAVLEFFSGERVEQESTWLKIASQAGIQLGRIFERRRAASELEKAHAEMIELSRRAGMAEVATGVLHNVGNVLNSVSVSCTLMGAQLQRSKLDNLRRAVDMLREKNGELAHFLTADPKGRLLPDYLAKAVDLLKKEQADLIAEAGSMAENIDHIKGIVAMQQCYAKNSGLIEILDAGQLVDDALRMNFASMDRHGIRLVREFSEAPRICGDRHQILQILINLVQNAKHALEGIAGGKELIIRVAPLSPERVGISVCDNGVGIIDENLTKIFNHGFTTKADGHGFGLHSGANAAKEMGGSLSASSPGEGRGATFVLELPVSRAPEPARTG